MGAASKQERAQKTFDALCAVLDAKNWKYGRIEGQLRIETGVKGDDLPIHMNVSVDEDRQLVMLLSKLPFTVKEDKRIDMAVAVSIANDMLIDGSFDFDVLSGEMYFRLVNCFLESELGEDVFMHMIGLASSVVDDFNDKFMLLNTGVMTLEQFFESTGKM